MSIPANRRNITAEELLQHPEWGPCELVEGEVLTLTPTNPRHMEIVARLGYFLTAYQIQTGKGRPGAGDPGLLLGRNPDTVRAPDALYTLQEVEDEEGFLTKPPELCIEVRSPGNTWRELVDKTREYLDFGVKLVWIVDPKERSVQVFRRDGSNQMLGESESLTGEDVLEGLLIPIEKLFN